MFKLLKNLIKYGIIISLGLIVIVSIISLSDDDTVSESKVLPPIETFGIQLGMSPQEVGQQLEGKVDGINQIGSKRLRNIATGELDGSHISVYTQSLYYDLKDTTKRLKVHFWDDKVKDFEYTY